MHDVIQLNKLMESKTINHNYILKQLFNISFVGKIEHRGKTPQGFMSQWKALPELTWNRQGFLISKERALHLQNNKPYEKTIKG